MGAFIGPSVSGFLYDVIGFQKSCIFVICLIVFVAAVIILFLSCEHRPKLYKELSSTESLIKCKEKHLSINIEDKLLVKNLS